MFLSLSKVLDLLVAPLTWALLLVVLALVLLRRPRAPLLLGVLAVAILWGFSAEPVSSGLMRWAERGVAPTVRKDVTYDAVILLGGVSDAGATRARRELQLGGSAERLTRTYDLVLAGRARHVIVTAGLIAPEPGERAESALVAEQLAAWGVAPDRVVIEDRARNTRENAIETARIVRERGWKTILVVTSAAHAPRAMGCFRAVGLAPDLLPVDWRGGTGGRLWPRAHALDASTDALRELAGRVAYWVMGYTRG